MKSSRLFCAVTLVLTLATPAHAENWPSRAMTLIVPFAAGGGVDVSARIQAQGMSERLGQAIVVENVGAAAGMAGSLRVAKAEPDGYTLLSAQAAPLTTNVLLYRKLNFDPTSFEPVIVMATLPNALVVRQDFPASSVAELIAYARANPGKINYGSQGIGTTPHLTAELSLAAPAPPSPMCPIAALRRR